MTVLVNYCFVFWGLDSDKDSKYKASIVEQVHTSIEDYHNNLLERIQKEIIDRETSNPIISRQLKSLYVTKIKIIGYDI